MGESLLLALLGGGIGILLTFPVATAFHAATGTLFKSFMVSPETTWLQLGAAVLTGVVAGLVPALKARRIRIVEGLRAIA
jgi:putative ABC transport system permease protein